MADTITSGKSLILVEKFSDGHEHTLIIDNPADTITTAVITELADFNVANSVQSGFVGYSSAKIVDATHTNYDISE